MNLNYQWCGSCIGMICGAFLQMLPNNDLLFFMFEREENNDNSSIYSTNLEQICP